jgi:hypothetical protein
MGVLSALLLSLLSILPVRSSGQYAQVSPEIQQWFNGLTNHQKGNCCAFADGQRIDDPDWEQTNQPKIPYRVRVDGEWLPVYDWAVVDSPNKIGYPIVWPAKQDDKTFVRCFMPGTGA